MNDPTAPAAPPVPVLPAVRRQALRHHLVNELRRPVRRSRRTLLLVPAGVLAVALAAGVVAHSLAPVSAPLVVTVAQGDHGAATLLLQRMAAAATGEPGPSTGEPGPSTGGGEYLYVKSRVAYSEVGDGPARLQPVHEREIWIPLFHRGDGQVRQPFYDVPLLGAIPSTRKLPDMTPNAQVVDLPADPDELLAKLYQRHTGQGNDPDSAVFTAIGDILRESLVPPQIRAALYRAAAKIPDVEVVRGVTDAAGRPGIAVAHTDRSWRHEWIFDERTFDYLGERSYLVQDTVDGPAGTVLGMSAVTQRAVVPDLGARPKR
ncbi:CU044_5270 family protein [Dactylosporangium sp. NPDC050588]|uniref:CU044_5270 family protein n=1 Tax=Dactylosporangium sp. NPDC050588 TaxID=3157211 RepID=UPI0033D9BF40